MNDFSERGLFSRSSIVTLLIAVIHTSALAM